MNELKNKQRHLDEDIKQEAIVQTMNVSIKPEDSVNITSIVSFYDNVAETMGLNKDAVRFDCTKIDVSRNIQENIFSVWEKMGASNFEIGMTWCNSGPKTDDTLPQDTISITHGFFRNENDEPLSLMEITAKAQALIDNSGRHYIPNVPFKLNETVREMGGQWDAEEKCWYHSDPAKTKEIERLANAEREKSPNRDGASTIQSKVTHEM